VRFDKKRGFSMYEVIVTLSILGVLSALLIVVSRSAGVNAKDQSGQTLLLAAESNAQKVIIASLDYPLYPSNMHTLMSVTDLTFVTTASTSESVVSVFQPDTNTLVLTILTGNSCWVLIDGGAAQPRWAVAKNPVGSCLASSINTTSVISVDRSSPSSISL
jgi:prepilin-type N-terminal cleavage/methylation domain-containing protein